MTEISYNCACDADYPKQTLAQLRTRMLVRLGYSQQLAAPPTGVVLKINDMLAESQRLAYNEYEDFRTERFYSWPMLAGVRFYDFPDNQEATAPGATCTDKLMDPTRVSWVGVSDGDRLVPLVAGIPPELYSNPQIESRPYRYEIRQCIEVWPAPESTEYTLFVKGQFGLLPFAVDDDVTTIDPDVVFYGAMFLFKDDRGDNNAATYAGMQVNRIEQLRAAGHFTARYVPGHVMEEPMARPIFLPLA